MIKRLLASVREYKKITLVTPLLVAVEAALEVIIPFFMADLIDYGIDAGNMGYIVKMGLLLAVCAVLSLGAGVAAAWTASTASAGFAKNLRHDMYYNIQTFSFSNIDKFSTASLVTRLTTDVANVQMSYQMLTRMAVRSPMMMLFATVMSFRVNARLSFIFVGAIPVLAVGLYIIMINAHPVFERVFKTYDKLNNVVQENVRGIRVVKSFVREDYETDKFDDISESIYKDFTKAERILAFNGPLMQFCMYACLLLISWFGARAVVAGGGVEPGMTTGQLMSLFTYVTQILMSLMMLSVVFVMMTLSRASMERVCEVLEEKSDITDPESPVTEVKDGSITFKDVFFAYQKGKKNCLTDIDLHINAGETIGIIGGTGSGKSTLVQLIPRLYDPAKGTVEVGGVDVKHYALEPLRDAVAMVLQKNELFSGTIKENLRWGNPDATDEELEHACRLACAHDFVIGFPDGYDTHIEQGGTNVSGGQKQRLCIARALLKKPKILILDDSTSAVDTATDASIRKAFAEEIPGTTKLIIAQRVASVQDADRIIVMEGGRINGIGNHEELLESNAIYREVFESQTKGGTAK